MASPVRQPGSLRSNGFVTIAIDQPTRKKLKEHAEKAGMHLSHYLRGIADGTVKPPSCNPQSTMNIKTPGNSYYPGPLERGTIQFAKLLERGFDGSFATFFYVLYHLGVKCGMPDYGDKDSLKLIEDKAFKVFKGLSPEVKSMLAKFSNELEQNKSQLPLTEIQS